MHFDYYFIYLFYFFNGIFNIDIKVSQNVRVIKGIISIICTVLIKQFDEDLFYMYFYSSYLYRPMNLIILFTCWGCIDIGSWGQSSRLIVSPAIKTLAEVPNVLCVSLLWQQLRLSIFPHLCNAYIYWIGRTQMYFRCQKNRYSTRSFPPLCLLSIQEKAKFTSMFY